MPTRLANKGFIDEFRGSGAELAEGREFTEGLELTETKKFRHRENKFL